MTDTLPPDDPIEKVSGEGDETLPSAEAGTKHVPAPAVGSAVQADTDVPVDETPSTDVKASAEDRKAARSELEALKIGWAHRLATFDVSDAGGAVEQRSLWGDATRRFTHNRMSMLALVVLFMFFVLAVFVPILSNVDPELRDYPNKLKDPSLDHLFGTDQYGRDVFARAWQGGRISLAIGFSVALVVLIMGVMYGSIAGYLGGRVDNVMMRLLDALYGLPYLPFAIIFIFLVKDTWPDAPPLAYMVPALSVTTWYTASRIIRGQVMSLKENEYIEAARSSGAHWFRIVTRHLVPNTLGVLIIAIFLEVPNAILGEAFLSFLGLGVQPPHTSWGQMAEDGYGWFRQAPHLMWVPGGLIAVTVMCAIAIADGLRDALDPRGQRN